MIGGVVYFGDRGTTTSYFFNSNIELEIMAKGVLSLMCYLISLMHY